MNVLLEPGPDGQLTGYVYGVLEETPGVAPRCVKVRGSRKEAREYVDARDEDPVRQSRLKIRRGRLKFF